MASIIKHKKGWRALINIQKIRRSKVFSTKQEAKDWAAREEYKIKNEARVVADMPLSEVLMRYEREVSPSRRGHRWESMRLVKIAKEIGHHRLGDLDATKIAAWRDARLRQVSPASVRREMGLVSAVLRVARQEWGLLNHDPTEGVRMPQKPVPRDRLPTREEMERLAHVAGTDLTKTKARVWHAFRFACETAMRAGEIAGLTWDNIDVSARVAHLPITKNGYSRDVPMSKAAMALLEELPKMDPVFGLTTQQIDANFRGMKARAQVEGLRFHDSRAQALTMLSRKVDVLTLAKISGHRDLRILQNVYYRETAASIAARLD